MTESLLDLESLLSPETQANLAEVRKKALEERRAKVVKRALLKSISGEPRKSHVRSKPVKTSDMEYQNDL